MGKFKRFLQERNVFVNMDTTKGKENLGALDDKQDRHIISQVKNVLTRTSIDALTVELLEKNFYPVVGPIRSKLNDLLISYFSGDFPEFKKVVLNNPYDIKLTDNADSIDSIANYYSDWLSKKFFDELTLFDPPIGGIAVGKGELVLGLFSNLSNAIKHGDLSKGSIAIEVKGIGARFQGQTNAKLRRFSSVWHKEMNAFLTKLVQRGKLPTDADIASVHVSKSVTKTVLTNLFNVLLTGAEKIANDKAICTTLVELMGNYTKVKVDSDAVKLLMDSIKGGKIDIFFNLSATLCLWCYTNNEPFTKLLMMNKNRRDFYVKDIGSSPKFMNQYKFMLQRVKVDYAPWDDTRSGHAFTYSG